MDDAEDIVDSAAFARARAQLGTDFARILNYFREDGEKAIRAIEDAVRRSNAVAIVDPAFALKSDAARFGANRLAALAEQIEFVARRCIETRDEPVELIAQAVRLGPLFRDTLASFDRTAPAAPPRRGPAAFGRRAGSALR